jgi:hypothetical protein
MIKNKILEPIYRKIGGLVDGRDEKTAFTSVELMPGLQVIKSK